ncbi:MAG: DUF6116 family protein [Acidimicrobiia bacterium]
MTAPRRVAVGGLLKWARRRRFPALLAFTGGLFILDVVVPDVIPFVDELLLGLGTLILARWKDRRQVESSSE